MINVYLLYRYAFRDNMTDVIIQHLITEQKGTCMFIESTVVCLQLLSFEYQNITSIAVHFVMFHYIK